MTKFSIPLYQPDLSGNEKRYVMECLDSTWISSKGRFISEFEDSLRPISRGPTRAIGVCNGTVGVASGPGHARHWTRRRSDRSNAHLHRSGQCNHLHRGDSGFCRLTAETPGKWIRTMCVAKSIPGPRRSWSFIFTANRATWMRCQKIATRARTIFGRRFRRSFWRALQMNIRRHLRSFRGVQFLRQQNDHHRRRWNGRDQMTPSSPNARDFSRARIWLPIANTGTT